MKKGTVATLVFLALIGYISFSMIWTGSKYQCEICMEYNDGQACQEVEGMDKQDTIMTGISTACGALANGMTETIECQATPPTKKICKKI